MKQTGHIQTGLFHLQALFIVKKNNSQRSPSSDHWIILCRLDQLWFQKAQCIKSVPNCKWSAAKLTPVKF